MTEADRRASPADVRHATRRAFGLLHIAFFVSGFCALVYQVAWQRMLGLFSGSDTVSATIVVAAFLFGLGVGSLVAAGFADRLSRTGAVLAFAACEVAVAACAALSPYIFYDLIAVQLVGVAQSWLAIISIVFAALLLPTLLMGLSLPLLSRAVVHEIEGAAARIGWLYGLNTLGAGLGALGAGVIVIGTFGYAVTVYFGAVLNLGIGVAALYAAVLMLGRGPHPRDRERNAGASSTSALRHAPASTRRLWTWCALVFASGFLIISLEIVWFRILGTLASTNSYAFSLILGVFLIADAAGIIVGAWVVQRVVDPLRFFLNLQGWVAIYAMASLAALWAVHDLEQVSRLFVVGGSAFITGEFNPSGSFSRNLAWLTVLAATVAPPALLLGMSFPIAQKAVQEDPDIVGLRVGVVQVANILGNTMGAIVAGLVLLHFIGTSGTVRVIGLLGLLLYSLSIFSAGPVRVGPVATVLALVALIAGFPGNSAFWARLHGVSLNMAEEPVVAEDRTGIVVVYPRGDELWMFSGGHAQSRLPFLTTHGVLGSIGVLLHPDPRSILIIGHGLGSTPYAAALATRSPHARVQVIEIVAPAYTAVEAQAERRDASPVLQEMLQDVRIVREVGDGRHEIFATEQRYDVIEADALRYNTSQSGLLYSVEFFRQMRDRLTPGGVAVQWAPTARSEASFMAAFPYILRLAGRTVGRPGQEMEDIPILIGSADRPVPFDPEVLAGRLRDIMPRLEKAGWSAEDVRDDILGRRLQAWEPADPRPSDLNTDLFPKDEYYRNSRKLDLLGGGMASK